MTHTAEEITNNCHHHHHHHHPRYITTAAAWGQKDELISAFLTDGWGWARLTAAAVSDDAPLQTKATSPVWSRGGGGGGKTLMGYCGPWFRGRGADPRCRHRGNCVWLYANWSCSVRSGSANRDRHPALDSVLKDSFTFFSFYLKYISSVSDGGQTNKLQKDMAYFPNFGCICWGYQVPVAENVFLLKTHQQPFLTKCPTYSW